MLSQAKTKFTFWIVCLLCKCPFFAMEKALCNLTSYKGENIISSTWKHLFSCSRALLDIVWFISFNQYGQRQTLFPSIHDIKLACSKYCSLTVTHLYHMLVSIIEHHANVSTVTAKKRRTSVSFKYPSIQIHYGYCAIKCFFVSALKIFPKNVFSIFIFV